MRIAADILDCCHRKRTQMESADHVCCGSRPTASDGMLHPHSAAGVESPFAYSNASAAVDSRLDIGYYWVARRVMANQKDSLAFDK